MEISVNGEKGTRSATVFEKRRRRDTKWKVEEEGSEREEKSRREKSEFVSELSKTRKRDVRTSSDFVAVSDVAPSSVPSVLSLGVLSNNDPVEVAGLDVRERRGGSGKDSSSSDVWREIEGLITGREIGKEGE